MEIRSGTITSDPSKRNCTKHKHGHNELFPSTIKIQKTLSDVDMSIFNINSQRYLQIIYDANTLIIPPYVSEFENLGVKLYPGPRALRHAGIASPVNSRYVLWWHCLQSCTRKCLVQSSRSLTDKPCKNLEQRTPTTISRINMHIHQWMCKWHQNCFIYSSKNSSKIEMLQGSQYLPCL